MERIVIIMVINNDLWQKKRRSLAQNALASSRSDAGYISN